MTHYSLKTRLLGLLVATAFTAKHCY